MGSAVKSKEAVNDLPVTWTAVEDLESWRTGLNTLNESWLLERCPAWRMIASWTHSCIAFYESRRVYDDEGGVATLAVVSLRCWRCGRRCATCSWDCISVRAITWALLPYAGLESPAFSPTLALFYATRAFYVFEEAGLGCYRRIPVPCPTCVRHLRIATCPLLDMWAACLGSLLPKDGRLVDSYAGWRITGPSVICATNSLTCRIAAVYPELDSTSMIALEVF